MRTTLTKDMQHVGDIAVLRIRNVSGERKAVPADYELRDGETWDNTAIPQQFADALEKQAPDDFPTIATPVSLTLTQAINAADDVTGERRERVKYRMSREARNRRYYASRKERFEAECRRLETTAKIEYMRYVDGRRTRREAAFYRDNAELVKVARIVNAERIAHGERTPMIWDRPDGERWEIPTIAIIRKRFYRLTGVPCSQEDIDEIVDSASLAFLAKPYIWDRERGEFVVRQWERCVFGAIRKHAANIVLNRLENDSRLEMLALVLEVREHENRANEQAIATAHAVLQTIRDAGGTVDSFATLAAALGGTVATPLETLIAKRREELRRDIIGVTDAERMRVNRATTRLLHDPLFEQQIMDSACLLEETERERQDVLATYQGPKRRASKLSREEREERLEWDGMRRSEIVELKLEARRVAAKRGAETRRLRKENASGQN